MIDLRFILHRFMAWAKDLGMGVAPGTYFDFGSRFDSVVAEEQRRYC